MAAALDRHVALVGFMGAGKTMLGKRVAERLGRRFVDVDREIEHETGVQINRLFAERGEAAFRAAETRRALEALEAGPPAVVALGGGAVGSEQIREALRLHALTVFVDVGPDEAWRRVRRSERPLAQDELRFRALYTKRRPLYEQCADVHADDQDAIVLAAGGVHVEASALERLGELVPGPGRVALVTEPRVAGIHGAAAQLALGARVVGVHELPEGEEAKQFSVCERLWQDLRLERGDTLVALGGGALTDAAGFVAATYLRGIDWVAVPTTLVGQVDAALGGKTALNLPSGKNLVGAFHWPSRVICDPALLGTLPKSELSNGLAEVVKTGLLAGEPLWELDRPDQVSRCAAFKTAVCLRDPYDRGERAILNLGHTFAHALEAAADYELPHGRAVGLGLLAALRLSGRPTDAVESVLAPRAVEVDPERAWQALLRDKKMAGGEIRLVLMGEDGPRVDTAPPADVRTALEALIA